VFRLWIATKWGNVFDEDTKVLTHADDSVEYLRSAVRASLTRLGTDRIDLYQLHIEPSDPAALRDECEDLVREGLIRGYAWSTDTPSHARFFAEGRSCVAVQHELSVLDQSPEMLAVAEETGIASINRTPLAMGLLRRQAHRLDQGHRRRHPLHLTRLAALLHVRRAADS
jgi:aryl-alcohol dehydrogenase-like predicted oxidoreductase